MAPAAGQDEGVPQLPGTVLTARWAVLFDMDGTLVDTEPLLHEALSVVLGAAGVPAEAIRPEELRGRDVAENLARLSSLARTPMTTRELYERVSARMLDRLRRGVAPLPGAVGLLRALRGAHVPCALVSSSYRAMVDAVLPSLGADAFAVTLAGDEVRRPKPDPEAYRTAAARLGVAPGNCVIVEDSATGLRSGRAAGCVTVSVVRTGEPVDLAVRDLSELTVRRLAHLVQAGTKQAPGTRRATGTSAP
ncbi:HAD family hydrolase [Streptomyces aurantiacus]|uniref:HAD family hydrolase n=1 Tax=Streptomyces aurantiacus TaxID=47760 RepID=UPI00248007EF|nr:HAD family phosphatase [Streptomyces aurantiacus]